MLYLEKADSMFIAIATETGCLNLLKRVWNNLSVY